MKNKMICKVCGEKIGRSSACYGSGKCMKCGHAKYDNILTKIYLQREYIKKLKSTRQIAKELEISQFCIYDHLKKYKIKTRNLSESHADVSGKKGSGYINGRTSKTYYCKESNCNNIIPYRNALYKTGRCKSCAEKIKWSNPDFSKKTRQAILQSCYDKPNKTEKLLNKLINKNLKHEYKFVGNGKIIFDGLNPDFININGQKKIIELYGDYWHNLPEYKERDKRRIKTYKKYGYKTLIVWEHELRNKAKVIKKIKEFNKYE